jgi:hypothetical protein
MKNKILIAVTLMVCTIASSCNDWLDVTPQAQVNADKLFSTPEGYESAVYGHDGRFDLRNPHDVRFDGCVGPVLLCVL